jgi:hypothetical protein
MGKKQVYHLNDRTIKYQTMAQAKRQHEYLGLPGGELKTILPQEIVFPNMDFGRADGYYTTEEELLINLEEESGEITTETKEKISKYVIFASYRFLRKVYQATICHKDPKKEWEWYEYAPSVYIKIHYIYFSQQELWERYDNVISKVRQKEELTDMEALDIAFVSKYISKEYAPQVIETLTQAYENAIINDKVLKIDVGVILGGMILKHIIHEKTQNKLLEGIGMRHIEKEIDKLVYDEYGDKLDAKDEEIKEKNKQIKEKDKQLKTKDKEIKTKDKEIKTKNKKINELNQSNNEYKNKVKELNELKDFNSPKAKQIIKSMMLL